MDNKILDKIGDICPDFQQPRDLRENEIPELLMKGMSEKQVEIYRLFHPLGGGLALKEVAERIGKTVRYVQKEVKIMRNDFQEAFMYENVEEIIIGDANEINNIYNGCKRFAASKNIEFNLTLEELEEIIRLSCNECGEEPIREAYNFKMGRKFKINHLGRYDTSKPYQYNNCYPICGKCIREGGYPAHIYAK